MSDMLELIDVQKTLDRWNTLRLVELSVTFVDKYWKNNRIPKDGEHRNEDTKLNVVKEKEAIKENKKYSRSREDIKALNVVSPPVIEQCMGKQDELNIIDGRNRFCHIRDNGITRMRFLVIGDPSQEFLDNLR
jgi:hypothetical protein